MTMDIRKFLIIAFMSLAMVSCSDDEDGNGTLLPTNSIQMGAAGGVEQIKVDIAGRWIASTDNPWITVSPANGVGSVVCEFKIDSALNAEARHGVVRLQNLSTWESREITVDQEGFPYTIAIDDNSFDIDSYKVAEQRYFDVKIRSNVEFDVEIPEDIKWLRHDDYKLVLNRGLRPREVNVRFRWDINTASVERLAEIKFVPRQNVELQRSDVLNIKQEGAEPIIPDTRSGDSIALLAIARNLNVMSQWDSSQPMTMWNNVVLWDESMDGCTPENVGRVKSVDFMLFSTSEPLPFEVRYLTAADELYFFGNSNTFLKSLELGDDICELTQLRRLTVGSYGLVSLPESFSKLKNLEYLNICANNFQTVPRVLNKHNFPKLRSLDINANQRSVVYDLSNTTKQNLGGFIDEEEFPIDLILWDLDTLVMSVNYLQGELPDFEDDDRVPVYTQEDIDRADTLPQMLADRRIKKVMPSTKRFAINYNRLSGDVPDWLLYHPALDWWIPYSLVFNQEGKNQKGEMSGFDNVPANLNYYYDIYTSKERKEINAGQ
ncbi:MAG: hypothetical protein IIY05_06130 [Alistipes sp.]|nr:hypothetical protein [Alistipes sp.]